MISHGHEDDTEAAAVLDRPTPAPGPRGVCELNAWHLGRIEGHAKRAYPEECCGILVGARRGDRVTIHAARPAVNLSRNGKRDRYEIAPDLILRVARASEKDGHEVVGFYHSHPGHAPAPSATDAARAWPGYVYVIVGVNGGGRAETRAWEYDEESGRFQEWLIGAPRASRRRA